jgi:serine/threonine-protein kinase
MALKLLYPQFLENETIRSRFLEEARIQFRLKHPNIVHITDVIDEQYCLGSVMEWVEGEDLRTYLHKKRSPLDNHEIEILFCPILEALHYVHQQNLVHRDIKPANILLSHEGGKTIPKLTDFGIAKALFEESKTMTGSTLGTVTYMAPEQINDSKQVTPQSDIYSVGVLLFQLVTGTIPFPGSPQNQLMGHLNKEPPIPSKINPAVSAAMDKVILWCLKKESHKRPNNCNILLTALMEAMGQQPYPSTMRMSTVPPPSLPTPMSSNSDEHAGLHTDLELMLDQLVDEDDCPTTMNGPDDEAFAKIKAAAQRQHPPSERPRATPPPSSRKGAPRKHIISGATKGNTQQPPWLVFGVFAIVGVLLLGGVFWIGIHLRKGGSSNTPSTSTNQPNNTPGSTNTGEARVCFNIAPEQTLFFFKFNEIRTIKQNAFCVNLKKQTRVEVWRDQYHKCTFTLKAQAATIDLKMVPSLKALSKHTPSYCLR